MFEKTEEITRRLYRRWLGRINITSEFEGKVTGGCFLNFHVAG
jgi:hypothetical protein